MNIISILKSIFVIKNTPKPPTLNDKIRELKDDKTLIQIRYYEGPCIDTFVLTEFKIKIFQLQRSNFNSKIYRKYVYDTDMINLTMGENRYLCFDNMFFEFLSESDMMKFKLKYG